MLQVGLSNEKRTWEVVFFVLTLIIYCKKKKFFINMQALFE